MWSGPKRSSAMADVNSFIVDAGTNRSSGDCANNVSPRVRLTTMAPHCPFRVRLPSKVARSLDKATAFRGVVKRKAGITGARTTRLGRALVLRVDVDRLGCLVARVVCRGNASAGTGAAEVAIAKTSDAMSAQSGRARTTETCARSDITWVVVIRL